MAKLNFKVLPTVTSPLDVARWYIAAGISVFPCHECEVEEMDSSTGEFTIKPEKSPRTSNGLKGATRSERIVTIWFNERHPNALIGVPTGEPLGAWVLDLDRHGERDGHLWLAEMEALHGPLPDTARASTANGGTHIFFKNVDGIRNRAAIAPCVDSRGQDGYIIAPGSVMADGRKYQWIEPDGTPYEPVGIPDFADTPAWLLDLLLPKQPAAKARTDYTYTARDVEPYVNAAVESEMSKLANAPVGQRGAQLNASAFSLGQLVAANALSRSAAEDELYSGAQSNGVLAKDGEKETNRKIKRGLDAGMRQPREIPEREYSNENAPKVDLGPMIARGLEKARKIYPEFTNDNTPQPVVTPANDTPQPVAAPKKRERFEITWFHEIKEGEPKETFIKGVLGAGELTTVSGLPGTGKSVIVTDMACHVAAGMEWHGRKVGQGLVVYVAAERKKLTERRMMAFRKHHNITDQIPLLIIGGRLDFTRGDLKDARELIAAIREAEIVCGQPCVWVIIDTLTRVFGAGDQNASKDMSKFVQSCDEVLTETKAHVSAIHHSAWSGERGKGAIDLDGAVDASFMVKKEHGKYRLVCDGTNDGEDGDILAFTMLPIELGTDEDGEPTTAPVVSPIKDVKISSGSLKGYKGDVLAALAAAIQADGIEPEGDAFPDDINVVDLDTWRKHFYASRDMETITVAATAKKQFQRAPDALVKEGHANQIGLWYWAA